MARKGNRIGGSEPKKKKANTSHKYLASSTKELSKGFVLRSNGRFKSIQEDSLEILTSSRVLAPETQFYWLNNAEVNIEMLAGKNLDDSSSIRVTTFLSLSPWNKYAIQYIRWPHEAIYAKVNNNNKITE